MRCVLKLMFLVGAAVACTNPVAPRQKFMGDPPVRIDPAPTQSGFQVSQATPNHP